MKHSFRPATVALAICCAAASAAAASPRTAVAQSSRVLQIGDVGTPSAVAASSNKRLSLLQAIQHVVPADWATYAQNGVDVNRIVDVRVARGTPWVSSLEALLAKQGLYSVADWDARSVYIRSSPADAQSVNRILNASSSQAQQNHASGGFARRGNAPATPAPYGHGQGYAQGGFGSFTVQRTDRTLRDVVQRWASQAGWAFESNYWAAPKDLPVVGASQFGGGFEEAVIGLLNTSRLTDMPVKPCFYSNRVVRVQLATTRCDWSAQDATENQ